MVIQPRVSVSILAEEPRRFIVSIFDRFLPEKFYATSIKQNIGEWHHLSCHREECRER